MISPNYGTVKSLLSNNLIKHIYELQKLKNEPILQTFFVS